MDPPLISFHILYPLIAKVFPFSHSLQTVLTTVEMRTGLTKAEIFLHVNLGTAVVPCPLPHSYLT